MCLLLAVYAAYAPQVGYLLGELLAFVRLQAPDHMPLDGAGQDLGLFEELLHVVFAKVRLGGVGRLVEREDVVCGLELRDGYEADLGFALVKCWVGRWGHMRGTHLLAAFAGCIDARNYAGYVFGELLGPLWVYAHVLGHDW